MVNIGPKPPPTLQMEDGKETKPSSTLQSVDQDKDKDRSMHGPPIFTLFLIITFIAFTCCYMFTTDNFHPSTMLPLYHSPCQTLFENQPQEQQAPLQSPICNENNKCKQIVDENDSLTIPSTGSDIQENQLSHMSDKYEDQIR